jgi:hypothetical protein
VHKEESDDEEVMATSFLQYWYDPTMNVQELG